MNTRNIEISVGLFVLIGFAALTFLAISVAGGGLGRVGMQVVTARFTNASGLKPGSTVRVAGVPVGEVKSIVLKRDDLSAWVTFRIESDLNLSDDTVAAIRSTGLLGDKFIALKPGASGVPLKPAATIVDTESTIDLEDLISRFAFGSVDKK
ncbi:MAG: outer membrane lipid asymmetry maintenance protein MlaD [Opitutaceae bacterium]